MSLPCPKPENAWCDREDCYHLYNLNLLELLHKKAFGEVKSKVFLTIGTVLPTELTEQIFEFVMAAEEVPLEPRVRDTILEPVDPELVEMKGRRFTERTKVKEEYRCNRMPSYRWSTAA